MNIINVNETLGFYDIIRYEHYSSHAGGVVVLKKLRHTMENNKLQYHTTKFHECCFRNYVISRGRWSN